MYDATRKALEILKDSGYRIAKAPNLEKDAVKFFAHDRKRGVKIQIDEEHKGGYGARAVLFDKITRLWPQIRIDGVWKSVEELKTFNLVEHCKKPKGHIDWDVARECLSKLQADAAASNGLVGTRFDDALTRPDAAVSPEGWEEFNAWVLTTLADLSYLNKVPIPYDFSKPMFERLDTGGVRLCHFYQTARVVGIGTLGKHNRIDLGSSDVPNKDVWFVISGHVASKQSEATCGMIVQPQGDHLVFHPLASGKKIQRGLKPITGRADFADVTNADEVIIREAIDFWLGN